jgi:hypothetical protein
VRLGDGWLAIIAQGQGEIIEAKFTGRKGFSKNFPKIFLS